MKNLKIRRYKSSDNEEVWELHTMALEGAGAFADGGEWDEDLNNIEKVYLLNNGEFIVGTLNGRIVAMGAFRKVSKDKAMIKRMRVHPDYQRCGYGQIILDELEKRAKDLHYKMLELDTTIKQKAAQNFFLKNGYEEVGRAKDKRRPPTNPPMVKRSGKYISSRSIKEAQIKMPQKIIPATALPPGNRSQHSMNNTPVRDSTIG